MAMSRFHVNRRDGRRGSIGSRAAAALAVVAGLGLVALGLHEGFVGGLAQRPGASLGLSAHPSAPPLTSMAAAALSVESLRPLSSYVLVRPKEAVKETKGGLLLSTKSQEKPIEGEVVSVGAGSVNEETGVRTPVWAQVGKKVMYSKYGAEKVKLGDDEYVLVRDQELLLSYEGEEATLESLKMPPGKLLVRLQEEEGQTEGGLLLSKGAAKPDTTVGVVVSVSEGVRGKDGEMLPLEVQVGDVVRFRYGNEVKLEVGKAEFRTIDSEDCLAKWRA